MTRFKLWLITLIVSFIIGWLAWGMYTADTTDCDKYDAAHIPQSMNPCYGGIRK